MFLAFLLFALPLFTDAKKDERTKIVLTNDDGWAVAQIRSEYAAFKKAGYKVGLELSHRWPVPMSSRSSFPLRRRTNPVPGRAPLPQPPSPSLASTIRVPLARLQKGLMHQIVSVRYSQHIPTISYAHILAFLNYVNSFPYDPSFLCSLRF